ncbi:MAG: hypothetical protein AABW72_05840 [archaeon]
MVSRKILKLFEKPKKVKNKKPSLRLSFTSKEEKRFRNRILKIFNKLLTEESEILGFKRPKGTVLVTSLNQLNSNSWESFSEKLHTVAGKFFKVMHQGKNFDVVLIETDNPELIGNFTRNYLNANKEQEQN